MLLQACGGGGGGSGGVVTGGTGDPAPAAAVGPAPATPTTRYLLNGDGGIGTAAVDVGADGNFAVDGSTFTLQQSAPSGCTLANDPDPGVCNVLAGGKGYLFCADATSTVFSVTMFRAEDVQVAPMSELFGKKLTGISCGTTGPRQTADWFQISADGSRVDDLDSRYGTYPMGYGGGSMTASLNSEQGLGMPGYQQRWLVYKTVGASPTQYFLLDLREDKGNYDRPPRLFTYQAP